MVEMSEQPITYDVVVIGGGPGGYGAALYGAAAGLNVALVERDKVGGACLHRGCVPAKEFLETASVWRTVSHAGEFGVETPDPSLDFSASQRRKQHVVDTMFKGLSGLLKNRKITVLSGTAQLHPEHRVRVVDGEDAGAVLQARSVILATGSRPRTLACLELDGKLVVTSDEFLALEELPRSAAVIGGGAIGCEFASLMGDLGVEVTIVEGLESILGSCDHDVKAVIARSFKKRKISVLTSTTVLGHTPKSDSKSTSLLLENRDPLEVEMIVVSIGRQPYTEGLLADGVSLDFDDAGCVKTDELMHTSAEGIYAVGDIVSGSPQLAHVGFAEAIVAIQEILGEGGTPIHYDRVPWAIYCHPEVAFAGLSETDATEAGYDVVIQKDPFGGNSRARILGDTEGMVKIVAEKQSDGSPGRILGVHMVGPWVTEQLGAGYLAVNTEANVLDIANFLQPHPTLSETFGETLLALTGRGLHVN